MLQNFWLSLKFCFSLMFTKVGKSPKENESKWIWFLRRGIEHASLFWQRHKNLREKLRDLRSSQRNITRLWIQSLEWDEANITLLLIEIKGKFYRHSFYKETINNWFPSKLSCGHMRIQKPFFDTVLQIYETSLTVSVCWTEERLCVQFQW